MPSTDDDPLGPELETRLRGELDAVRPLYSSPRYQAARRRPLALRFAPALLAVSLVGILSLSAFAATGSPNPVVWTQRFVTVINTGQTTPTPTPTHRATPPATPSESPEPSETQEPAESPEPRESPEPQEPAQPRESPEPSSGEHSGSGETSTSGTGDGGHESPGGE